MVKRKQRWLSGGDDMQTVVSIVKVKCCTPKHPQQRPSGKQCCDIFLKCLLFSLSKVLQFQDNISQFQLTYNVMYLLNLDLLGGIHVYMQLH